jgi:WD40 repeat protein/class 3 adenylate cyclase/energy-coupling factor transporter ATP-binding protein EcfA2
MRTLPAGTVTFLFTDIEGSTRLLHQLGDVYAAVLADQRRLLREAFARHGGVEVDTQGDSFFVAFADPRRALAAAADAQTALARHAWPDGTAVRVRMGLHTGEPLVADDHYVGVDVHRGARIAAAAHGGQALVSERTRELAGDATPGALRDLGAHRLKDLPEPERLYQLVIDGLPSSFPPPRVYEDALEAAGLPDYSLPPADVPCPYKGLVAFERDDAELFFGREQLVENLAGRLEDAHFLAVVGASGSGKSSLVGAGIVPELQRRDGRLRVAVFSPGERPLAQLTAVGDARLLVVDQFEEVFTLCRDEAERRAFIDVLLAAAERGTRVVIALRADFYGHSAAYPRLAAALEDHQALVGPMSEEELRRAIERPADGAGLILEPGLVEGILRDVVGEPGALPLLSHSLLETWKRRSGRMLTLIGYLQAGGVQGAIAKTAETVYRDALSPEQQGLARNIFLRLTELGEGTEDTRRRVAIAELPPRPELVDDVNKVLRTLADARLVSIGEGTVEVAHEALIRHWPTLRRWLDEDREGRLVHRRLTQAAHEWDAADRDPALLYRGTRLGGASDWAVAHDNELNELERGFLRASREAELHEIETMRRRNRRLRVLLAATGMALAVAIVAGVLALNQRNTARATALTADAQRLGAEALTEDRLDRALLLARAGVELEETARTRSNLLAALLRAPDAAIGVLRGTGDAPVFATAVSPNGRVLAIGDESAAVTTFDTTSRRKLGEYRIAPIGGGVVQDVEFSPDGRTLAVTGYSPAGLVLDLVDARALELRSRAVLPPFPETVDFVAAIPRFVSGGGDVLVLQGFPDGPARSVLMRVDGDTGTVEGMPLRVGGAALDILPTRDGRRVFVTSPDDDATLEIDAESLRVVGRHPVGGLAGALSPDGGALAVGSRDGTVRLLDLRSQEVRRFPRRHGAGVLDMAFTPDGRTLVSSDADGAAIAWDAARGQVREVLSAHRGPVWKLALSRDGDTLYSGGDDGRVILWDLAADRRLARSFSLRQEFEDISTPRGIAVSPDGETLAFTGRGGTIELFDTATLQRKRSVQAIRGFAAAAAFSPDGRLLAVGGERGQVSLWDGRTLTAAGALAGLSGDVQAVAFSPDGESLAAADVVAGGAGVRVWSVRRRALIAGAASPGPSLAFSPDGRLIALSALDGPTEIRDARTGSLVERLPTAGLSRSVAFSTDGSMLAVGHFDGGGQLYSTETWKPIGRRFEAHTQRITNVEFTRDGRTLATSSADGTVLLWDVDTQEPIGPLPVEPDTFVSAALSPDGSQLFAVSTGLRGIRLAIDPRVWKRHACVVAGRELTQREWTDALPGRRYRTVCSGDGSP